MRILATVLLRGHLLGNEIEETSVGVPQMRLPGIGGRSSSRWPDRRGGIARGLDASPAVLFDTYKGRASQRREPT
jgi:hypothetical protein